MKINYHDKTQSIQVRVGCKLVSFGCKLLMLVLLVSREMWYALHGLGFTRWFLIDHIHMYGLPSTHWLGYKRLEMKVEVASRSSAYIQISAKATHKNLNHFNYDNHESLAAITITLLHSCTAPNRNKTSELCFRQALYKRCMQKQN